VATHRFFVVCRLGRWQDPGGFRGGFDGSDPFFFCSMHFLSRRRVSSLLAQATRARLVVIGDVILDVTMRGVASRLSGAGPFPVMEVQSQTHWPGGAANVACNVAALGAKCLLTGVLGADDGGERVVTLLRARGVEPLCVSTEERPTTVKTRYLVQRQYLLQSDRICRLDIDDWLERQVWLMIESRLEGADAVVCSDYGIGVLTQSLLERVIKECRRRRIFVAVDPKLGRTWAQGADLLTPNRSEAFAMAGARDPGSMSGPADDAALMKAAEKVMRDRKVSRLLVTLSEHGMVLFRRHDRPFHVPALGPELVDILGAGDTVVAAFATAIAAGASEEEATEFASMAAGIAVGKLGCAVVTPEEMRR
jgi:rfaE bifunctional protein kinase chain/domain